LVKLLPYGYLDQVKRIRIARALGAKKDMAEDAGATAVGDDLDYADGSGGGRVSAIYLVPRVAMKGAGTGCWANFPIRCDPVILYAGQVLHSARLRPRSTLLPERSSEPKVYPGLQLGAKGGGYGTGGD